MKMYLRGLGIGIIVTAIILIIARNTGNKMSDREIIERAEELGMVMKETTSDKLFPDEEETTENTTTETTTTEPSTTEAPTTEAPTTEAPTTEAPTTEAPTTEAPTTEAPTTEAPTTEAPTTEAPTQPPTQPPTIPQDTTVVTAKIVITRGMYSEAISQAMERTGVISDWRKFNDFLEANGYAERLQTGTFTLKSTMTYDEMAKILTSR